MATPATATPPFRPMFRQSTTKRGIATASFCLGLWGFLTFWMYPFGLVVGSVGVALGLLSVVMGYRTGNRGEHLAWWGIFFGASGAGAAITIYRFYQLAFEGTVPTMLP